MVATYITSNIVQLTKGTTFLDHKTYEDTLRLMRVGYFGGKNVAFTHDLVVRTPKATVSFRTGYGLEGELVFNPALAVLVEINDAGVSIRKKSVISDKANKQLVASSQLIKERIAYFNSFLKKEALPYKVKVIADKGKQPNYVLFTDNNNQQKPIKLENLSDSSVLEALKMLFNILHYNWEGLVVFTTASKHDGLELFFDYLTRSYGISIVVSK